MIEKIKSNLLQIQEKIVPYTVNIIAVTKYYDTDVMLSAYKAGLRHFGVSRAVDAVRKINELPDDVRKNSTFHFIGHLQSNKVRLVVNNFDYIHSVDSLKLAQIISDEAIKAHKKQKVFLQLNNACEEQKFGFKLARACFNNIFCKNDFERKISKISIYRFGYCNFWFNSFKSCI